jgi:hypothetical protein
MYRKSMVVALFMVVATASAVGASSNVGVDVNINVGTPPLPPPAPPMVVVQGPPVFIMPPSLGFYVAVGVPYDLFHVGGTYYLYQGNSWYRAPYYNGPWKGMKYKQLPPGLRKHRHDQIISYRDQEYRVYRDEQERYRGRHFKPDKEWKEQRKEEKEHGKEEKKREKEENKEHKKHGKHGD